MVIEDWKFKRKPAGQHNEQNFTNSTRGINVTRGRGIANNVHVSRKDETADVFGLVEIGQKSTHDPYDLNSIRTNLQTLAAQPNFTSKQYQKIVQLLNKEEKAAEMVNMVGNSYGSCVIPAAGDLFNGEVKGIGKEVYGLYYFPS
ncbi:hypothetical protein KY285_007912 [Solanum tuberosum]|nr:hypothetical protein KY285_007912 [Solanum tuberosum]